MLPPKPLLLLVLGFVVPAALHAQVDVTITAAPGTVTLAPGLSASGWFYDGQLPGPVLRVTEGQVLRVRFINGLSEPSTIHWHGVPVPAGEDGVPAMPRPAVPPGQEHTYEFVARPAGTYFFHPHVGLQLDRGLYGVLLIDPAIPPPDPPDREHVVVLDDWLGTAPVPGQEPVYASWLLNGRTSAGQAPLFVNAGETVRFRFINASAGTHYAVALDGHQMVVTHADGQPVQPVTTQAIPIGAGERYDVVVMANHPGAWSLAVANLMNRSQTLVRGIVRYGGSSAPDPSPTYVPPALSTGTLLSYAQLAPAGPVPPMSPSPQRNYNVQLTGSPVFYNWAINGQQWPNATPFDVQQGETARFTFVNMSPHLHPMHVHGHFFRMPTAAGGPAAPILKDTILVPMGFMGGQIAAEIVADNPGMWMFHCHQIYHAEAGMMTMLRYVNGDADHDGLMDAMDMDPVSYRPVLHFDDLGGGFALGTPVELRLQLLSGATGWFFLGPELPAPMDLGAQGVLRIHPDLFVGSALAGPTTTAALPVPIPQDPALSSAIIPIQGAATHPALGSWFVISTFARLRIP